MLQVIEDLLDHHRVFGQAMTFTAPPQALQVAMSILKTRLSRCAQVIDARRSAGVGGSSATLAWLPLPRFAGVTNARCRPLGANTPCNRVSFTRGFGTRAARLAMKSSGSLKDHMRGAVPVRRLQWVANVAIRCQ